MKSKIIYHIKHNAYIKLIYIAFGSSFLKMLGHFIKTDNNLVLFVANVGKNFSGSPYEIFQYLQKSDKYSMYKCIWAFIEPDKFQCDNAEKIKIDTLKYFIVSLRAKYWITDVNIERSLKYKKRDTKYLNTWHGVALKLIGNDDKNSGRYDYSNIDFLCVSGEHDKRVYRSALNASSKCFLECGMPRNDKLFSSSQMDQLVIKQRLGFPHEKKVILYAPTWRDSINYGESYDLKIPIDIDKWKQRLENKYIILFRAHDRTTKLMGITFDSFIRDYSYYEPLNDLLIACDVLITDYSSILFDYAILKKPFICFGYDYQQYSMKRGVYFEPDKVYPGGIVENEEEVINRLLTENYYQSKKDLENFKSQFMEYSHGKATEICVEKMFGR